MSKIEEILDGLRRIVTGSDRSSTPQFRKLAESYAAACVEVNAELAACRRLIERGLWPDALARDTSVRPPFSVRAEQLAFPEKSQLDELCRLYRYPEAPDPDLATARLLENPPESGRSFNRLVLHWRRVARDGAAAEKVHLLRRIVAEAPPEGGALWRENLRQAEKNYRAELLQRAALSLRSHDMPTLQNLYQELADPVWLEAAPDDALTPFRSALARYQQEQCRNAVATQLNRLAAAYSELDVERTRRELAQFDHLATHPLFQAAPEQLRQVEEARNFTAEADRRAAWLRTGEERTRQLLAELDGHGDYRTIENLYEGLRQSDFPIAANLAARFANRRQEFLYAERRRHVRCCVYVVLAAIVLLAAGGAAILFSQRARAERRYRQSMTQQLAAGNYEAVLQLCRQAGEESFLLGRNDVFADLKAEAERRQALDREDEKRFAAVVRELDELHRRPDAPSPEAVRGKLDELAALAPERRSPDLREAEQRHRERYQQLLRQRRQQADNAFQTALRPVTLEAERLLARLRRGEASDGAGELRADLRRRFRHIQEHTEGVSPQFAKDQLELTRLKLDAVDHLAEQLRKRDFLRRNLYAPPDRAAFQQALARLPAEAPDWAEGEWQQALELAPLYEAVAQSAALGSRCADREELRRHRASLRLPGRSTPMLDDLDRLLPRENWQARIGAALKALRDGPGRDYDCYELVFQADDKHIYRFYTAERPIRENRKNIRLPKALLLRLQRTPDGPGEALGFRITADAQDAVRFRPTAVAGLALPEEFPAPLNMDPAAPEIPKARHGVFLSEALRRLAAAGRAEDLEKELLHQLELLKKDDVMNPYARLELARRLLELLPQCSVFYEGAVAAPLLGIDRIQRARAANWRMPTEAAEYPRETEEIERWFQDFDPARMRQTVAHCRELHILALERGLAPGGVILIPAPGKARAHWFNEAADAAELWLLLPDSARREIASIQVVERRELGPDGTLPEQFQHGLCHGMIFFIPFDGQSTAEMSRRLRQTTGEPVLLRPASWPDNRPADPARDDRRNTP